MSTQEILLGTRNTRRECFSCRIVDCWGESFIIIGASASTAGLVYSIASTITIVTALSIVSIFGFGIAFMRVRKLAIAKHLMDSVNDLKEENEKLKLTVRKFDKEVSKFKEENKKFEKIVGLLGDDIQDIDKVKDELFKIYEKYEQENDRYEGNNLLSLFRLVDKNDDSYLNREEMNKMKQYAKLFYGHDFDFSEFDSSHDDLISIEEFVNSIKKQRKNKVLELV